MHLGLPPSIERIYREMREEFWGCFHLLCRCRSCLNTHLGSLSCYERGLQIAAHNAGNLSNQQQNSQGPKLSNFFHKNLKQSPTHYSHLWLINLTSCGRKPEKTYACMGRTEPANSTQKSFHHDCFEETALTPAPLCSPVPKCCKLFFLCCKLEHVQKFPSNSSLDILSSNASVLRNACAKHFFVHWQYQVKKCIVILVKVMSYLYVWRHSKTNRSPRHSEIHAVLCQKVQANSCKLFWYTGNVSVP